MSLKHSVSFNLLIVWLVMCVIYDLISAQENVSSQMLNELQRNKT